jgi:hypothetical protein
VAANLGNSISHRLSLSLSPFFDLNVPSFTITTMDATEEQSVTILTSMMGDGGDPEMVRRILRKHNGDVQKAATSILEGDTGAEDPWPSDFGN